MQQLFDAVKNNSLEEVKSLINEDNIQTTTEDNWTLLHLATVRSFIEIA